MDYEVIVLQPAEDFLRKLETKLRAKAFRCIQLLERFGPHLPMPHVRKLSGCDLHELRSQIGSNTCRLFYFHKGQRVYVVTSGYVKKAHRTSRSEIDRAMRLKRQYEEASEQ